MGTVQSTDDDSRWILCIRWKNTLFRSTSTLNTTSTRYLEDEEDKGPPQPWQIVSEESPDKWKKSPVATKFDLFPVCRKKVASNQGQKWYNTSCYDSKQDKNLSSITYQIHSYQISTLTYSNNEALTQALDNSELQCIVPCKDNFVAFHFISSHEVSNAPGILLLYEIGSERMMYLFVETAIPYKTECVSVSPDHTMTCLLLSEHDAGGIASYIVQVYSKRPAAFNSNFQGASFELEYEIPDLKSSNGCPKIMFDPRYYSSRLGMINVTSVQNIRVTHYFLVYDLKAKKAVIMTNENYVSDFNDLDLLDAGYSPDGAWVHAVVGHTLPDVTNKYLRSIWIMNSNTLEIVKTIDIGSDHAGECPINFLPTYSQCSRMMALRQRKCVKVYQLPVPKSLRDLCRSVIRQMDIHVTRLSVPDSIRNYIQFKPYL